MVPVTKWPIIKSSWILLGFSALAFELVALYFQYGMKLEPCIMCIYQRVAIMGIMFAGFITALAPGVAFMRGLGYLGWGISAVWGLLIAKEHVSIQTETDPFAFASCALEPNFPAWFRIDHWFPGMFEVRGDCGTIDWQFLSLSMPQWMIVVFGFYTLALVVVLGARLFKERKL
jgi:disulfide bond formation protein DsbB